MSRVGIFSMAYEAVRTLVAAYERIPAQLKKEAAEIYIIDDASNDDTFWAGIGYKLLHNIPNLNVYRICVISAMAATRRVACVTPSRKSMTLSWFSMETCNTRPNASRTSFNRSERVRRSWCSAPA